MTHSPTKPTPLFPAPEWTSVSAQMAAQLAHEIRNPLLSIKGAAQLLEKVVSAEDKTLADYDPSLPNVAGLREPLIQVLLNLIKNAVDAVEKIANPTITITTRYLVGESMQRTGGRKLPVAISITDNGVGVPAELEARLFTPFTTTKPSGKGLGLAIVARIVEEHGGLIAHDRPAVGGARFTVYLPLFVA
ncbi:MAG: hypothetical protein B7X02_01720 [Rhodospirillales bacterium 12-54-5]|nr:MAG: hypothetical protein B7X02_01720 [Rhodospirillales bacterium 12-54-5]